RPGGERPRLSLPRRPRRYALPLRRYRRQPRALPRRCHGAGPPAAVRPAGAHPGLRVPPLLHRRRRSALLRRRGRDPRPRPLDDRRHGRGDRQVRAFDSVPGLAGLSPLTAAGGRLFFPAYDRVHGIELWESDGTAAGPRPADPGTFWFFTPTNVELVVKVLAARALNQAFWVFYGALPSVEYTITVPDTATGLTRRYWNPSGRLASVGDTDGFGPLGA